LDKSLLLNLDRGELYEPRGDYQLIIESMHPGNPTRKFFMRNIAPRTWAFSSFSVKTLDWAFLNNLVNDTEDPESTMELLLDSICNWLDDGWVLIE